MKQDPLITTLDFLLDIIELLFEQELDSKTHNALSKASNLIYKATDKLAKND